MESDYKKIATDIRLDILKMTYEKKAGFIGSSFSCVDVFAVLYSKYVNIDDDMVILSKGHAASAWYATLANAGVISKEKLFKEFNESGYCMGVHPSRKSIKGVETSNGSLGQGLGLGCGVALANKIKKQGAKTYVILGDGECNEGAVWESVMLANRFQLSNLIAIIDRNRLQSYGSDEEVLNMNQLKPKFESFGWNAIEINGHDYRQIDTALEEAEDSDKPTVIIANTIKGKGVKEFENKVLWHYKWPEKEHYMQGVKELEEL